MLFSAIDWQNRFAVHLPPCGHLPQSRRSATGRRRPGAKIVEATADKNRSTSHQHHINTDMSKYFQIIKQILITTAKNHKIIILHNVISYVVAEKGQPNLKKMTRGWLVTGAEAVTPIPS